MSHENTHSHTQIEEYIKNNIDLQKAIELLRREKRVTRAMLEIEFNWSEWKARKVYELLRYVCYKGLSFKLSENRFLICRAYHGEVRLLELRRHFEHEDIEVNEEFSQEAEEEEFDEEEEEEVEEEGEGEAEED